RLPGATAQLDGAMRQADVDLAADPEASGQIDPRLDGEAGVGEMPAPVARLEVVVVDAVAVAVVVDAVPGPMQEPVGEASLGDHLARGAVQLRAGREPSRLRALPEQEDGGVPGLEDVRRDALDLLRHLVVEDVDAGEVRVD